PDGRSDGRSPLDDLLKPLPDPNLPAAPSHPPASGPPSSPPPPSGSTLDELLRAPPSVPDRPPLGSRGDGSLSGREDGAGDRGSVLNQLMRQGQQPATAQ